MFERGGLAEAGMRERALSLSRPALSGSHR